MYVCTYAFIVVLAICSSVDSTWLMSQLQSRSSSVLIEERWFLSLFHPASMQSHW